MFVFTNVFTTGVSHVTFHFFTFQPPRTEMYLTLYYAIMLLSHLWCQVLIIDYYSGENIFSEHEFCHLEHNSNLNFHVPSNPRCR